MPSVTKAGDQVAVASKEKAPTTTWGARCFEGPRLEDLFKTWHQRLLDVARLSGHHLIDQAVVHRLLGGHEEVSIAVLLSTTSSSGR